jgi:hypothetical protein
LNSNQTEIAVSQDAAGHGKGLSQKVLAQQEFNLGYFHGF